MPRSRIPRVDRMLALVAKQANGCWLWQGRINASGYGAYGNDLAHRALYQYLVGPITRATLDHLCEQRSCVNPAHLRPASIRENALRGSTLAAANAAKTQCPQGHPYSDENTYVDSSGRRHCRICQRIRGAAWHQRNRGRKATSPSGI